MKLSRISELQLPCHDMGQLQLALAAVRGLSRHRLSSLENATSCRRHIDPIFAIRTERPLSAALASKRLKK